MKFYNYKIANIVFHINLKLLFLINCMNNDVKNYDWKIIITYKKSINNTTNRYKYEVFSENEIGYSFDFEQKIIYVDTIKYDLFVRTFFTYPLQRVCFLENSFLIHAAACTRNEYDLNLFIGECGIGKSTLCNCLKNRFNIVSDDGIKINLSNDKIFYYPTAPFIKMKNNQNEKELILIENFNINYVFCKANIFILERIQCDCYKIKIIDDEYIKRLLLLKNIKNIFNNKLLKNTNEIKKIVEKLSKCNMFYLLLPDSINKLYNCYEELSEEIISLEGYKNE